ncbi:YybS family protein [Geochorda subterranea]|uniref:DUF2232 domain-containing protein n=1 Tax=Geochorda subterranea TaxID=3109564 RepID=A0ABZ1BR64_9FIRM|nr:DUF2232 domain-containing protein [Limnochorda sp. LNt]WRP14683.1 DUF2232 domain-containing protein [Limnochorda sp. LNt]
MVRRLHRAVPPLPGRDTPITASSSPERVRVRRLTEGGLLAAVTVVLGWLSLYVPYLIVVLPAPMALLVYRHGVTAAISAWVVAAILSGVLLGGLGAVLLLIPSGLTGLSLGMALHAGWPPGRVLAAAVAGATLATLLSLGLSFALVGIDPIERLFTVYEEGMQGAVSLYGRLGLPAEQLEMAQAQLQATLELMRVLLPVLLLSSALVSALVNHWAARAVLVRLGERIAWFEPFARWRSTPLAPALVAAGLLVGMVAGAHPWVGVAAANLSFAGAVIAFVQGLSLVWFWFDRAGLAKGFRLLLVLLVLWLPIANLALVVAGLVDPWFNFRRL